MESHCTSTEKHSGIRRSDPLILDYFSSLITLTHRSPHSVERFHDLSGGGTPSPATPPCRCSREPGTVPRHPSGRELSSKSLSRLRSTTVAGRRQPRSAPRPSGPTRKRLVGCFQGRRD